MNKGHVTPSEERRVKTALNNVITRKLPNLKPAYIDDDVYVIEADNNTLSQTIRISLKQFWFKTDEKLQELAEKHGTNAVFTYVIKQVVIDSGLDPERVQCLNDLKQNESLKYKRNTSYCLQSLNNHHGLGDLYYNPTKNEFSIKTLYEKTEEELQNFFSDDSTHKIMMEPVSIEDWETEVKKIEEVIKEMESK